MTIIIWKHPRQCSWIFFWVSCIGNWEILVFTCGLERLVTHCDGGLRRPLWLYVNRFCFYYNIRKRALKTIFLVTLYSVYIYISIKIGLWDVPKGALSKIPSVEIEMPLQALRIKQPSIILYFFIQPQNNQQPLQIIISFLIWHLQVSWPLLRPFIVSNLIIEKSSTRHWALKWISVIG